MPGRVVLPLFPLKLVVFPGEMIPLHIFEDRYKALVKDCQESTSKMFGISCLFEEMVAQVGCSVTIERTLNTTADGSLDIIVRGFRRYRLEQEVEGKAYARGAVEYFDDSDERDVDPLLRQRVITLFIKYSELSTGKPTVRDFTDEAFMSFSIAGLTGLSLPERQMLLEMPSEIERLQALDAMLTESVTKLTTNEAIEERVHSNGHFKH